jgi:thioredoxin 1
MQYINIISINTPDFENIIANKMVVIDFYAEWCQPCKVQDKYLVELSNDFPEVIFAKINVDDNRFLSKENRVLTLPTLLFFKEGKEVSRLTGVQTKLLILNTLNKLFLNKTN